MAQKRLMQELIPLHKEKWVHIETDEANILRWRLGLWVVNPDSIWHGAYLRVGWTFPSVAALEHLSNQDNAVPTRPR